MRHNCGAAASLKQKRSEPSTFEKSKEGVKCGICGQRLLFSTGEYGQSLEACENDRCVNHHPHRPQPDSLLPERRQRTSKALRGPAR